MGIFKSQNHKNNFKLMLIPIFIIVIIIDF